MENEQLHSFCSRKQPALYILYHHHSKHITWISFATELHCVQIYFSVNEDSYPADALRVLSRYIFWFLALLFHCCSMGSLTNAIAASSLQNSSSTITPFNSVAWSILTNKTQQYSFSVRILYFYTLPPGGLWRFTKCKILTFKPIIVVHSLSKQLKTLWLYDKLHFNLLNQTKCQAHHQV